MACNRISKRITCASSLTIFLLLPFTLKSGESEFGIEFVYDHKGLSVFFSGACKTNYVEAKVKMDPYKPLSKNSSLQLLPVHKPNNTPADNALSTALAGSLTIAGGTLLYLTKKEIERRLEDQKIDILLQRCDEAIEKSNPDFEKIERRATHG
jgi:hypothetical protein